MKLSVQNLVWRTIDDNLLNDISLEVDSGEICVFAGASDTGKTTLLRLLAGLDCPDAGEIWCGQYSPIAHPEAARRWVGYVPKILIGNSDTVTQFLDFSLCLTGAGLAIRQKQRQILIEFTGLGELCNTQIRRLSIAQKRQLGLARALIFDPPFLALDEPFTDLTADEREFWRQMLQTLASRGKGILLTARPDCTASKYGGGLTQIDFGAIIGEISVSGEGRQI